MSFRIKQSNFKEAGFASKIAPKSAPRSAPMRRPIMLAGNKDTMLKNAKFWVKVAPSALEHHFKKYINAIEHHNQRSKYMDRLGISKLEISRRNLLRAMNNHKHNLTSVIMRLNGYRNNPKKLQEAVALLQQEKRALKHADLLPLSGAIKQAKSAMNANINLYPPSNTINFSQNKVNRLKREKLLSLSNHEIDNIVNAIRLKIPKK